MKITGLREKLDLPEDGSAPDTLHDPKTQMVLALAQTVQGRNLYAGTVPQHVTDRRRARNKQARASRRTNRGRR